MVAALRARRRLGRRRVRWRRGAPAGVRRPVRPPGRRPGADPDPAGLERQPGRAEPARDRPAAGRAGSPSVRCPCAVAAGLLFATAPLDFLERLLGVLLVVFVRVARSAAAACRGCRRRPSSVVGAASGLGSALVGSVGPLTAPFFLARGLVKDAYIGTEAASAVVHARRQARWRTASVRCSRPRVLVLGAAARPGHDARARGSVGTSYTGSATGRSCWWSSRAGGVRGCCCCSGWRDYLSSLLIRRSASGLPPVWQVGQYCRLESANDTSRTVSPQTGHGFAGAAVHGQVGLLLALELARGQAAGALDRVAEGDRGWRRTARRGRCRPRPRAASARA